MSDVPVDLYIATYSDPDAAQQDWDGIKQLARDDVIEVDGLVLVSRDDDGKIKVKDNANDVGKGAAIGAVGGAIIGLIFPPALIALAVVGGGIGAGAGAIVDRRQKKEIKADIEDVLPPGSSGIVALFEERWVDDVEKALAKADKTSKHEVDGGQRRGCQGNRDRRIAGTDELAVRQGRTRRGPDSGGPARERVWPRAVAPPARLRRSRSCRPGWRTRRSRRCTTSRPN